MDINIKLNENDLKDIGPELLTLLGVIKPKNPHNCCEKEIKPEMLEAKPVRQLEGDKLEPCIVGGVTNGFTPIIESTAVEVEIPDVPQLTVSDIQKLYALGVVQEYGWLQDFKVIELHIVQPRIDNIDSFTLTYDELMEFAEEVKEKALLTENENSPCVVGDWCDSGFCRAKVMCKAYANHKLDLQSYKFKSPDLLTTDELEDICNISDKLVSWAKIIKEYALDLALKGHKFISLKAVEGKSNRKIIDDIDVLKNEVVSYYKTALNKNLKDSDLDSLISTKKVKSITDFEKAFSKKVLSDELNGIWTKSKGTPTLVPITDKRPELGSVESDLEDFNIINKELEI